MNEEKKFLINEIYNEIHSKGLSYTANKIKELYPEAFAKQLPERGWLISSDGSIIYRTGEVAGYGLQFMTNVTSRWIDSGYYIITFRPENWREATHEEVEQMLLEEAKKRYGNNEVMSLYTNNEANHGTLDYNGSVHFYREDNDFYIKFFSGYCSCKVFDNGEWAKLAPSKPKPKEMTMKELTKELGYEVKIIK